MKKQNNQPNVIEEIEYHWWRFSKWASKRFPCLRIGYPCWACPFERGCD